MARAQLLRNEKSKETGGKDKADPERGMDIVVDLVLGEGKAREVMDLDGQATSGQEEGEWPLWLFLGKDGMDDLRKRLNGMERILDSGKVQFI